MAKHLLIVESPAKAKTIEKILGKDFTVKSSFGHIRDLSKDKSDQKAIDVENNYQPNYIVSPEKKKVVKDLKDWVKKVDEVWLATDEDREGEAISWHLAKVLGLDANTTKRIVFREITKPALKKAIQTPRSIDMDVVNAQQARRILDRLIGFELSPLLWKKVKRDLSAGRVQSVAVKLVVERERAIQNFKTEPFFRINAIFQVKNKQGRLVELKANLRNTKFPTQKEALSFLENCTNANYQVGKISVKPAYRRPAAPFTTSTLQQEASRKLGFSVSRTMTVAQRLYEAGHITYMRTDSTTLSQVALQNIGDVIEKNFGANYHKLRQYKNKNANAQEAHEAVRPTYADRQHAGEHRDEQRLYELIWKRTVASQMADAQLEKTTIDIDISTQSQYHLVAEGQVLKFDGFLKVYLESKDEEDNSNDDDVILPPLKKGQALDLKNMTATERFTRPQPHYTEASLVKKLEELGIGRPSTYAPTIAKIMDPRRGYVAKDTREGKDRSYAVMTLNGADKKITETSQSEKVGAERNKLFASDMGRLVTDFLSEHFDDIMTYSFTADIEDKLDAIAHGKKKWINMIDGVYKPFHERVEHTLKEADRANIERILGKHPESGLSILVRMGKYGPMAQIGTPEEVGEELKPQYSSLKKDQSLETITLEECLELFKLPKHLGTYENQDVVVNSGRFGAYIKFEKSNISVPRDEDPTQLTLNRAIELIKEKQKADAPIGYYAEKPITKGSGRFGPFVKWDNLYVSISKKSGFELETITEAQAIEIIKVKQEKEANRYIHNWEDWKISVENGRWGPFIKMVVGRKKENYKLLNKDGKRMTSEEAKELTFDQVKAIITDQGGVIKEPKKPKAKKAKTTTKKTTKAKAKTTKKTTK